jgi:sugar lactone lactonase YvrE
VLVIQNLLFFNKELHMASLIRRKNTPLVMTVMFSLVVPFLSVGTQAQKIYTVAGGYVGDGGPATSTSLAQPLFAAFDQPGNLYVSESLHCRMRKVDIHGNISTVAGTGICGYSGDGGPATNAKLSFPTGVAVDAAGDVFFVDSKRIRQIDTFGKITTVAGKGVYGSCGDGGPALKACLGGPLGLAVSGNDLYIADYGNCRIRKVSGGVITTVAGNGTCGYAGDGGPATKASLYYPSGVAIYGFPPTQTLWISNENNVIRRVDMNTGIITTWWGDGHCYFDLQHLCDPGGIAVDAGGNLFVADTFHYRVLAAAAQGGVVVLEAGGQGEGYNGDGFLATSAMLNDPFDVAVNNAGNIFTVDTGNGRIRSGGALQPISTVAGGYTGDGGQALQSSLNLYFSAPGGISFDPQGNLYIADSANYRIRKVSSAGVITTFAGSGITGYTGDSGPATSATMNDPSGVAVDQHGNVFISDSNNQVVRKVDSTGTITFFAGPFSYPQGLTTDASGNVYAVDQGTCVVWKITPSGGSSIVAGVQDQCGFNSDGIPATQSLLNQPNAVALDSLGDLYITDSQNIRIRMVNRQGTISTVAGNGTSGCGTTGDGGPATAAPLCPYLLGGLALDAAGNFYIADNRYIRVVNSSGIIQTLAGSSSSSGYNGNGLPALKAGITPFAIAVSPNGVVYFSDLSFTVRKIQTTTATALSSSQNPSLQGQPVTFTATVTGSTGTNPVGTVTFKAGTKSLGKKTLSGGKASVTTSNLPQGANTVTATFSGGTDFTNSSASLVQTVN